ncbi:MAG: CPBP family intramembrane metalloprotease [Herpetosiphonaceae bacterium]|nr:CPBP family intramembrane metalloprotease [Herpetosiphonaceae bacterium]
MSTPQEEQARRNAAVLQAIGAQQPAQPEWPAQPQPPQEGDLWVPPLGPAAIDPTATAEEGAGKLSLAFWVLPDAVFGMILALALQVIALFGFMAAQGLKTQEDIQSLQFDPTFTLIAAPTLGIGFATMAVMRIRLLRKLPWSWFGLHLRTIGPALGWGTVAGFAFLAINFASGLIFERLGSTPDQAEQIIGPFRSASSLQLGLLGLFIVVVGPFLEELFFRGYVLRAIRQRLGATWGIVLSGALFAAPHALSITTGFIGLLAPIFIGGLILGYVYQRTGNLWSCVLAHSINNLVGFLGLLAALSLP